MILEVDEVGYVEAVDALRTGNRLCADLLDSLELPPGMAGSDASGADFASVYDPAAALAVAAIADAAASFATLGRLSAASDATHRASEAGSIVPGAVVDAGCAPVPEALFLTPEPLSLVSALGADLPVLSAQEQWILDHVRGFLWPDASPSLLRSAATTWSRASSSLAAAADCCTTASCALLTQRSPEIPTAVAATDALGSIIRELADDCGALAAQCAAYADAVEATHAAIRALLREVLAMVVEGLVVSALLGAITAGVGVAGGTAAVALRVSQTAPRFWALLRTLTAAAASARATLTSTHSLLLTRRAALARYLRVPVRSPAFGPRTLGAAQRLRYEASPKHHTGARGRVSPAPRGAQEALDFSVPIGVTTTRRVSIDPDTLRFVVFDETTHGVFHGHVREWGELSHTMQNALRRAGLVDRKGRILDGGT